MFFFIPILTLIIFNAIKSILIYFNHEEYFGIEIWNKRYIKRTLELNMTKVKI